MGKNLSESPPTKPNPTSCRDTTCQTKSLPRSLALSHMLSIKMDQRRIRIRMPKLWAKNAIERQAWTVEDGGKKTRKKTKKQKRKQRQKQNRKTKRDYIRPGKLLPIKKVSSLVSSVLRHKKSATVPNRVQKESTKKRSGKIWDSVWGEVGKTFVNGGDKADKKLSKPKKRSLQEIKRVPSRILIIGQRLKTIRSTRKKEKGHTKGEADQAEEGGEELCKKRILMGEKCKPMNLSGTLQYDRNGILLPDALP